MKAIRIFFIGLFSLIALLLAMAWALAHYYGDEIKTLVVESLNTHLNTKVEVSSTDFSLIGNFPFASIEFYDVVLYSSLNETDTLAKAERIDCKFNVLDLYHGDYRLLGLEIENGFAHLVTQEDGINNFQIWDKKDSSNSSFSLDLEDVDLSKLQLKYSDKSRDFEVNFFLNSAQVKASINDSNSLINIKAKLAECQMRSENLKLIDKRSLQINSMFDLNYSEKSISISPSSLQLENLDLEFSGLINYLNATHLDLKLQGKNVDLKEALSILPSSWNNKLADYTINGKATIEGEVKGEITSKSSPAVDFYFDVHEGLFEKKSSALRFFNTSLKGSITNGANKNLADTKLEITHFKTELKEGKLSGQFKFWDFVAPKCEFKGDIELKLKDLLSFLEAKKIENSTGIIEASIAFQGKLSQFNQFNINDFKRSGFEAAIELRNIALDLPQAGLSITESNANINFENNQLQIENLNAKLNENELSLQGDLFNFIPFCFSSTESMMGDLMLKSKEIDLNSILGKRPESNDSLSKLPSRMNLFLQTEIEQFKYSNLELSQLKANIVLKPNRLVARDVDFKSIGGQFLGDAFWEEKAGYFVLSSKAQFSGVNLSKLFKTFDNFGQSTIRSEQIKGKAEADFRLSMQISPTGSPVLSSVKIESQLGIADGELNEVSALESLSKYIELEELKKIRFKSLSNQLLVKDCTIIIPKFQIKTSALDLSLEGKQHFNQNIDYHFVLLLSDILKKKVKKPQAFEYGYVEDDGLGKTKVFLQMKGTVDSPEFSYDKSELKSHLKGEVEKEKSSIKSILNKEFGLFKKDSTILEGLPSEKKKASPFTIDWEEKPADNQEKETIEEEKKANKKGRFGKFIDKIAKPNEEEFERPREN